MAVKLRNYQSDLFPKTRSFFSSGQHRVMLVGPPGCGKGTIIAKMAVDAAKKGVKVLIFMHKRDLAFQQAERIKKQFNYHDIGFFVSGVRQVRKQIMIGTVQTMVERNLHSSYGLVILDECHRIKTDQHQEIVERVNNKYFVGFTATPFRGDKQGFKDDFDVLHQFTTYNEMVENKFLVPTVMRAPDIDIDLDGLKLRAGKQEKDFTKRELIDRFDHDRIYDAIVHTWKQEAKDRKTIFFTVNDKHHCRTLAEWFKKSGISCESIDSDVSKKRRAELLKAYENSEYQVLINIGLFTEGISIDDVDAIGFAVATQVWTKWVQAATRGSRPVWNDDYSDWRKKPDGSYQKKDCLILDYGNNHERFGYVDDYDVIPFTLDGTPPPVGESKTKFCPKCDHICYVQTKQCPNCGHVFEVSKEEKNQAYADEVKWKEVNRMKVFWQQFSEISNAKLMAALKDNPHLIRLAGKSRGYSHLWAVHKAYEFGYLENKPNPRDKQSIANGFAFLKECERRKGIFHLKELEDHMQNAHDNKS